MRPSLLLDFANTRRLDPRIVFARASVGTHFDRFGVLKTAPVNEPRFDFDPITGYCKGLLIEEARTNLFTYSSDFSNAAWTKSRAIIAASSIAAPDGSTMQKLCADATTGIHGVLGGTVTAGTTYVASIHVYPGEETVLAFASDSNGAGYFNALTKTWDVLPAGWTGGYVELPGGVLRPWVCFTAAANSTMAFRLRSNSNWLGDGVAGLYIWGAQIEAGSFAASYIPTTSATVTRSADLATMSGDGFTPWYRQNEGAMLVEYDVLGAAVAPFSVACLSAVATTPNENITLDANAGGQVRSFAYVAGNMAASTLVLGAVSANTVIKQANSYASGAWSAVKDGGVVQTAIPTGIPVAGRLNIGRRQDNVVYGAGHIRRLAYFPKRLSDAVLQELTR